MKKKEIKFYDKNHAFGALANTADLKVEFSMDGNLTQAPSSECIYQAVKGMLNPNTNYKQLGQEILNGKHGYARSVQIAGQKFNNSNEIKVIHNNINHALETVKYYIMRDILKAKLTQHPVLLKALIEKVNAGYEIVEEAPNDDYWGIGNGNGQNKLGKILAEVAKELDTEMQQTGKFKVCNSFSAQTAKMIKAAGLVEPKAATTADKFFDGSSFNKLPSNYNTEIEINNYYKNINVSQLNSNNHQQSYNINATDMKDLANKLIAKGQFGKFTTESNNKTEVKYEVNQNGIVSIDTKNRNGGDVKVTYNTKNDQITENGNQVSSSGLGDWAFGIIKSHAETFQPQNVQNNLNNSKKITLTPIAKNSDYKNFLKQVIKQESDCKFTAKSKSTPISVAIKHDQGIIIKGIDNKGNDITVKELANGTIFENGNIVADSEYLRWAAGTLEYAVNHADQINVETLGSNDYY